MKPVPEYVWPNFREAEAALLIHIGNTAVEKLVVRRMSVGELSGGLAGYAPAIVEMLETGEAIAAPVTGRVLSRGGALSATSWKRVRAFWEEPARTNEARIFQKLPVDRRAVDKVVERRISTQLVAQVTHYAAPPGGPLAEQLGAVGWWKRLGAALAAHAFGYAAGLTAWALIGRAALSGRWDEGWFWGWVILVGVDSTRSSGDVVAGMAFYCIRGITQTTIAGRVARNRHRQDSPLGRGRVTQPRVGIGVA